MDHALKSFMTTVKNILRTAGSEDEGDRFVEIWDLVFMQYNKHKDGKRDLLPSPL